MDYGPRPPNRPKMEKWWNEHCEGQAKQLPILPNPRPRALTPSLTPGEDGISSSAPIPLYQKSCFWLKVPPNIRRDILRLAFGDTRLHIYLHYHYRNAPPDPGSKYHCRLVTEPESWGNKRFPVTDQSQAEGWQWRGSRCHRYPPNMAKDPGPMTHRGLKGPWDDYCCNGGDPDICEAWRDEEGSSACNIGVMGWLLSCRQNYMETVEVLYSTNTLMLGEVCMVEHLPFLIPPQRFEMMTSLEITWSLKTHYTANQDYDDMDESHLRLVFDLLSPSKFPALRRLYIWFAKDRPCWLNINGIETYQKIILEQLDLFVKERTNLQECGFALPRCFFKRILAAARGITLDKVEEWELLPVVPPHGQVWRDVNGDMTVLQLPYVDSYPKAPYHIPARDVQVAGYWILESSYDDLPTYRRTSPPPPCFCPASTSPYQHRALHRDRSRDNSQSPPYSPRSPHYSPLSPGFSPTSPAGSDQPCVFEIDDI